jgi:hypothetical protein
MSSQVWTAADYRIMDFAPHEGDWCLIQVNRFNAHPRIFQEVGGMMGGGMMGQAPKDGAAKSGPMGHGAPMSPEMMERRMDMMQMMMEQMMEHQKAQEAAPK